MKYLRLLIVLLLIFSQNIFAKHITTDANIIGDVQYEGEHLPFVNIFIKGTVIGTTTDETGHFQIINAPVGELTLIASYIGYKTEEVTITTKTNTTIEYKFKLSKDVLNLSGIVVSANRYEQKHTEAPIIVSIISPRIFENTQTATISEGLNYSPGLRLENNCQNCGFSQVRINGLEGAYSQILINSRPIFSGLAGVYGLELIPSNMIEQIEIVKGGGSVLFGSNAIAGTINLILKDPVSNIYEAGISSGLTGVGTNSESAFDYSINFNTSVVSNDKKTGLALYGFSRERNMYDANSDGYSEIAPMENLTIGTRLFHRFGYRNKLSIDFFNIKEERNGGNKQEFPLHERDIAEALKHDMKCAAITFNQYFRESDNLEIYYSFQDLSRNSYYGANQSLSDYGYTHDFTYNLGAHYYAVFEKSKLITGIEKTGEYLIDEKLSYPDFENYYFVDDTVIHIPHTENTVVSNQNSNVFGIFSQYEFNIQKLKLAFGGRYDKYTIKDLTNITVDKTGNIFSPRISIMYNIFDYLQARINYSQGYRAPQIFDEDLHIETSGSRQVINQNDPDLKQETSNSYMVSLDFNKMFKTVYSSFLIEGFYTSLTDPFVNEIGVPDNNGVVIYTRKNAESGAIVKGVNVEFVLRPSHHFLFTSGLTIQSSQYDDPQEFDERRFFRTPNNYGYFDINWNLLDDFGLIATGVYTGKMLVPYFGPDTNPDTGELKESNPFFDIGMKLKYNIKINGATLQIFGGMKNIFNSFQSDYDTGIDRDPTYIYGPVNPRTIYVGINIGNKIS